MLFELYQAQKRTRGPPAPPFKPFNGFFPPPRPPPGNGKGTAFVAFRISRLTFGSRLQMGAINRPDSGWLYRSALIDRRVVLLFRDGLRRGWRGVTFRTL